MATRRPATQINARQKVLLANLQACGDEMSGQHLVLLNKGSGVPSFFLLQGYLPCPQILVISSQLLFILHECLVTKQSTGW